MERACSVFSSSGFGAAPARLGAARGRAATSVFSRGASGLSVRPRRSAAPGRHVELRVLDVAYPASAPAPTASSEAAVVAGGGGDATPTPPSPSTPVRVLAARPRRFPANGIA